MSLVRVGRRPFLSAVGGLAASAPAAGRDRDEHDGFEPLDFVSIEGARDAATDAGGSIAYVAADDGFATVALDDPAAMELLAERRDLLAERDRGPLRAIWDVRVDGDRLAVVGPAHSRDSIRAAVLFDVTDPADPERVAVHETEFPIHNCFLRDGVLYLTGNDGEGNPLVIVDADEPSEVGRWSILDAEPAWEEVDPQLRVLHDVWVQDGLAYLPQWDAGTWVVDVSDPADPEYVTDFGGISREELANLDRKDAADAYVSLPGNDHYVTLSEDGALLALGREAWATEAYPDGDPGGVDLWDVSDLDDPVRLSRIDPPPTSDATRDGVWTTAHNCDLVGDQLYTSWYQGGVKVHDVRDPGAPEELAHWHRAEEASFWTAKVGQVGEFFVASSFDMRDPERASGLYAFPDRRPEPPDDGDDEESADDGEDEEGSADDGDDSQDDDGSGDGPRDLPGFGFAVTGAAGLAAAGWRLWRGR